MFQYLKTISLCATVFIAAAEASVAGDARIEACWKTSAANNATDCWSLMKQLAANSVVQLEIEGLTDDLTTGQSSRSPPWNATGFILTQSGYVLTNSHVFPSRYQRFDVTGHVGDKFAGPQKMAKIPADSPYDFALLKFLGNANQDAVTIRDSFTVPDTSEIMVLGFPQTLNLTSALGRINAQGAEGILWVTSANINPGSSGSPAFDKLGNVVAVAEGEMPGANSINYLVPINFAKGIMAPFPVNYYAPPPAPSGIIPFIISIIAVVEKTTTPSVFDIQVDNGQTIHALTPTTNRYNSVFNLPHGFVATKAEFESRSCNFCGPVTTRLLDPSTVQLSYTLTSGPLFDQTRGWINGVIHVYGQASDNKTDNVVVFPEIDVARHETVKKQIPGLGKVSKFVLKDANGNTIGDATPGSVVTLKGGTSVRINQEGQTIVINPS